MAPLGRETSQSYDELNRVSQIMDAASGTTSFAYDALGQLISVVDPRNLTTSYTYNVLGDLLETLSPDTGTTTNAYDASGNLFTSTDARGKIGTYAYDALNRLTSLTYPDQTISLTYDTGANQKGRLKQVTDGSGSTSWTYDTRGRVLSRQQAMGISRTVSYTYTANSRVATMTFPSGSVIGYTYSHGKPVSITLNGSTVLLSDALYQPFGRTRGWTWGNASLAVREYNLDGLPTQIDSAGLKSYGYDDASRVTAIEDGADAALNQAYTYDLLDRVSGASGTGLNQGWSYDANHNRSSQTGSLPSTYTMAGGSNRLASITGALTRTYTYDAAGNVTSDGTSTFAYNDAGRMVASTIAGATTTYAYNALGERVRKQTSGTSTYFVYDETGHLIGEYGSSGNLIQEIVWLDEAPVAVLKPNGAGVSVFYIHTDHLNTPRRITRPSDNAIVWRWESDPFGTLPPNEDPDGDAVAVSFNLRFPGQYYDVQTGSFYNYFRDYDPATGRYVQSDPIGLGGGLNTYAYVGGNPISFADPLGLLAICDTYQEGPADRRTWTEVSHQGIKIPGINMYPTGPGVGPNPSLHIPRRPPIGTQVRWEVWFVWLHFRRDINTSYEKFIRHMVSFCKDKITDKCGREKETTLEPSRFDITGDPVKTGMTETDIYLFTEMVRRLGET